MFIAKLKAVLLILALLPALASTLSAQSRGNRENFAGVISSHFGHGITYDYFFSSSLNMGLSHSSASAKQAQDDLNANTTILQMKYFPFETSHFFMQLGYISNDWLLTSKGIYEGTANAYELERVWGSGGFFGMGFDAVGGSKNIFGGSVGLAFTSLGEPEDDFVVDGGGTEEQMDEVSKELDRVYDSVALPIFFYVTLGIRF